MMKVYILKNRHGGGGPLVSNFILRVQGDGMYVTQTLAESEFTLSAHHLPAKLIHINFAN